jgi:CheY-like chemotaxis protein
MKNTKFGCVLLIDDNPADNYFHEMVLSEEEFSEQIIIQESVLNALSFLEKNPLAQPDIIFLDINMPGLDGWQFLERYRQLLSANPNRPAIFMLTTGILQVEEKRAAETKMVDGFLQKPINPEDLVKIKNKLEHV